MSHWVFAYGSLMWRPGFSYLNVLRARLDGFHRSLCHYSYHYRGTEEKPGLVFALDESGFCEGLAFEVADQDWEDVHRTLHAREMLNHTYLEVKHDVVLQDQRVVSALCYVMNRAHQQYAGHLTPAEKAQCVKDGEGTMGWCLDYVEATHRKLRELGIHDPELDAVVAAL
jgi:glutathione-specific gamma-glutamylcyclotransferase